jgi:hypothetical protein
MKNERDVAHWLEMYQVAQARATDYPTTMTENDGGGGVGPARASPVRGNRWHPQSQPPHAISFLLFSLHLIFVG